MRRSTKKDGYATSSATTVYTLDKAGNRLSVGSATYTPNVINQYSAAEGDPVTNGSEHEIASYLGVNYTYLNDGQLARVNNGTSTIDYAYDALGRCVKRTFNGGFAWYYIYDGERPILGEIASGWIGDCNIYGKGIDEILEHGGGGVDDIWHWTFYNQDANGNVTHLTDATGAVVEKYQYDAFGRPLIYNGAGAQITESFYYNRFLFTGREYESSFGIYHYRARAYHPRLGRFMSEDPIGFQIEGQKPSADVSLMFPTQLPKTFEHSEFNLFRYCSNDPLDQTDPTGLTGLSIIAKVVKIIRGVKDTEHTVKDVKSMKAAVRALKEGGDVRFKSEKLARQAAREAGGGKTPIKEKDEFGSHYHDADRAGGHAFYSIANALTIRGSLPHDSSQFERGGASVLDFFNPLSIVKDALEIRDAFRATPNASNQVNGSSAHHE